MQSRILIVCGGVRAKSHTRKGLRLAAEAAREAGAEIRFLELAEAGLPLYNPDIDGGDALVAVREQVLWANGFILGSPDYHGSMSPAIVNFLAYFWQEFTGKLFGYVCASHEKGLTVMEQMRTAVRQCYGWSLPYGASFNGDAAFEKDGSVIDANVAERLRMLGFDMANYSALLRGRFEADLAKSPREPGFAEKFKG